MPTTRYVDDPDYGRADPRGVRRDREGNTIRDTRDRDSRGERVRPMEVERPRSDIRPIDPMDMMPGDGRRANTAAPRVDPRTARAPIPNPRDRDDDAMDFQTQRMPNTSYDRMPQYRNTPTEDDFRDLAPQARPIIDPGRSRDESRPQYNEYFLPGEGIDREVIQSEICRYLGQDATCKPGSHTDGRRGYIIRAYRALTTEMIRSLKEDSAKYQAERDRASRRNQRPLSYAQMRETRYPDDMEVMDVDDDPYTGRDPRGYGGRTHDTRGEDPRAGRIMPTTTAAYIDPGYPAYAPGTMPPPPPGVDNYSTYPRTVPGGPPGHTTPPSGRTPIYGTGYAPPATRPPPAAAPVGAYADPRGEVVRGSNTYGYQEQAPRRHR